MSSASPVSLSPASLVAEPSPESPPVSRDGSSPTASAARDTTPIHWDVLPPAFVALTSMNATPEATAVRRTTEPVIETLTAASLSDVAV